MVLAKSDHASLQALLRGDVEKTLSGIRRFTNGSAWLGKNNRYVSETTKTIKRELDHGALRNPRQLSQYIAASTLLHCADGWSYLGRSLSALLRGDPHRARHLGYYAELRAAMSLLASIGIGVFDKRHIIIDAPHSASGLRTRGGTHQFVWDCLEFWGEQNSSGTLFASVIRPTGRTLEDWLQPIGGAQAVAPQAQKWFLQWGMDLQLLAQDRNARNESSYRPDGIPACWCPDAEEALSFVYDMWTSLEPSPTSHFDIIDRHILRISVEALYRGQRGIEPSADPDGGFGAFVQQIVDAQDLELNVARNWFQFLTREIVPDNIRILELSRVSPNSRENGYEAVLSRAALLLRIATGSTSDLFQSAGFTSDALTFWWSNVGHVRGLWEGAREPEALIELWSDIQPLLRDVEDFRSATPVQEQTFYRIGNDLGHTLAGLGSCERIALWSLPTI